MLVFGLAFSKNRVLSYVGSIERGMGIDFHILVLSNLFLILFLIHYFGALYFISLLLFS